MDKSEILYGIHPVFEAVRAGRRKVYEIYIAKQKDSTLLRNISKLAEPAKIPLISVKPDHLTKITGSDFQQNIAAKVSEYPLIACEDILNSITQKNYDFLLLLDTVVDPQNLGALARTALCAGVSGIVITKDRSASPTPAVSKASAGALEHIFLSKVTNMVSSMKEMKDRGIWVVGMDAMADMPVFSCDLKGPIALVIGSEGKGIRQLVKANCDFLVSIPQKGEVSSLNASAAGAVAMYEVFRQRNFTGRLSNSEIR